MNNVVLIGRLTKDPDLRFAAGSEMAICRFTIAVNRMKKDDGADFINCIAFGKTGETISKYLTKGRQIAINGSIRTGSYDAKDGTKRYTTEVIVGNFEFIAGDKQQNNNSNNQNNAYQNDDDSTQIPDDGDIPF